MVPRCPYEIFPSRSNPTPPRSTKPTFAERFRWFGKDRPSRAGRRGRARGSEITRSASATPVENSATWRGTRKRVHVIRCTADREKVDKRTRSKWSRALRYALVQKTPSESLVQFVKRKGGINRRAERFRAHQRDIPSWLLSSE